ncbi:MAG: PAS domain S-box protein [Bacteroidetes bacterium]|nr:PAS domain S-box protein [Bacteroidota bacterium]
MKSGRNALLFFSIVLPVLLVAIFGFLTIKKQLLAHVYDERHKEALLSAQLMGEKLDHLIDIGNAISGRTLYRQFIEEGKWDKAMAELTQIPQEFPYIKGILITDTTGRVKSNFPSVPKIKLNNQSSLDWYKGLSKNWKPYISEIYQCPDSPQLVACALAMPVKNQYGQMVAILLFQVNMEKLLASSSEVNISNNNLLYIVDQHGHVVIGPGYSEQNSLIDYSANPAIQKALNGKSDVEILYDPISKQKNLAAYQPVKGYGWVVLVQQEAKSALTIIHSLIPILLLYSLIIFISIFSAWLIIREINLRRKSAEELQQYTNLIENTHVLIRKLNGEISFWNKGMELLYGWEKKEAIGKRVHQLLHTQFFQPLVDIEHVLVKTNEWQGELLQTTKDGRKIYVSSHWILHRNRKGEPIVIVTNNDITNLKIAEAKLTKSEESIRLLVESVKDYAIFQLDVHGCVASWNSGAEYIKGYKSEEILGKSLEIFYTAEDIAKATPWRNLALAREQGRHEDEGWRVRKDGSRFYANVVFTALYDEGGALRGYAKVTRDITERNKALEQIALQSQLINQTYDAIFMVDRNIQIQTWNQGAEKMYGFTKEEAIGKNSNALLRLDITHDELVQMVQILDSKNHWTGQLKKKTKEGKDIYVLSSISNLRDKEGNELGYMIVTHDITKQHELRKEVDYLANLVEQSNEAIVSRDLDYRIRSWNRGAEKLLGFKQQETIGRTLEQIGFLQMSNEEMVEFQKEADKYNIAVRETNHTRKDGSTFVGETSLSSIKNEKGEVVFYTAIVRDISERKKLHDELKKMNEVLELKVQERTQEVYNSELRFRSLIENSAEGISLTDHENKTIYRSPSAFQILGYNSMGRIKDFAHPDDVSILESKRNMAFENPGTPIAFEGRFLHASGEYIWLEGTQTNMLHVKGVEAIVTNFRDVTERKNTKEKLASSERRFRAMLENNTDMVSLLDSSFRVIYKSPSAKRLAGWSSEEYLYQHASFFAHPDFKEQATRDFEKLIANPGKSIPTSFLYRHKDGHYFWVEGIATNLLHDKDVQAIVLNLRDVTERKIAETKIRQTLKELSDYKFALDESSIVSITDSRGLITYANENFCKISKLPASALVGQSHNIVNSGQHPQSFFANFWATIKKGEIWRGEILNKAGDGSRYWVHATVVPFIDDDGNPYQYMAIRTDITERKLAEEKLASSEKRFRALIENSSDAIVLNEPNSNILYQSPSVEKILGYSPEERNGRKVLDYIHPDYQNVFFDLYKKLETNPGSPFQFQYPFLHKQGYYVWLEGVVTNLLADPDVKAYVANYRDITERKVAETKMIKSEKKYREVIERISDGFLTMDLDWTVTFVNKIGEKLVNRKADYLIGKSMKEEFPEAIGRPIFNSYETAISTQKNTYVKAFSPTLGKWFDVSVFPSSTGVSIFYRDITEQMQAEELVRKSEEKYSTLIQRITDGFISLDKNLCYTYLNKRAGEMINMNPDDLIGKCILDVFPDSIGSPTHLGLQQAMKEQHYVYNIDYTPGIDLWHENHIYPSADGLSVFFRDITEKKRAEEKMRESNERFELVSKATNDIIWDWDPITDQIHWNENFYTHFGFDPKETSIDNHKWEKSLHPEDRDRVVSALYSALKERKKIWIDDYRFIKANGEEAFIHDCGYILFDEKGNPYRMVGAMIDITSIRKAEEEIKKSFEEKQVLADRLATILNTLPASIALLDNNGVILDVNQSWNRFADENAYTGPNYPIGDSYVKIAENSFGEDKANSKLVASGINAVLHNKANQFVYEYPCDSPTEKKWFRMIVTPIHGKTFLGAVVMHIDISELRRLEQERMAIKVEEQKKVAHAMFVGQEKERKVIAQELHDNVNQILAGTNLFLSLAIKQPQKRIEHINYSMENIKVAIEENRRLSHLLVPPDFDASKLTAQLVDLTNSMLKIAGIEVALDATLFKEELLSDEQKLAIYRITQEQCSNIIKYAHAKKVRISLSSSNTLSKMVIADDGRGMEPGKKVVGIGLKNIRGRLSIFNGKAHISSVPGKGFVLEVQIPSQNTNGKKPSLQKFK